MRSRVRARVGGRELGERHNLLTEAVAHGRFTVGFGKFTADVAIAKLFAGLRHGAAAHIRIEHECARCELGT